MNRNFVILILFLLSFVSFGQIKINGKVTDSLLSPLSYANIQILDSLNKKIYAFGTTKNDGTFSIEISNKGLYKVKASFLGFESKIQKIYADKDTEKINFILTPKTDELKEIIIKYNPDVPTVKKDTIIYNLKKLTNGQENNLKEILEKLPGININEQGKVTAFGKKVGKLLIDGEDIFKEQHQFATENITAEMIAGVSFFQKYEGFANIKGFNNDQTTALNINIKDTYKNRITGNVDINGGVLNKYLGHANIFRLGKKLKLTLLSDINNIGKESISFDDYIDLNTTVKSTNFGNSTYYDDNDIPTFLSSTRDVAYREIGFGALNFVYSPKENLKISGYSIFNTTSQNQFFFNTRNFFEDQPDQTENRNIYGDFVFNTTQIKAAYKIGQSTFIQYTITNKRASSTDWLVLNSQELRLVVPYQEGKHGWDGFVESASMIFSPFTQRTWIFIILVIIPLFAVLMVVVGGVQKKCTRQSALIVTVLLLWEPALTVLLFRSARLQPSRLCLPYQGGDDRCTFRP